MGGQPVEIRIHIKKQGDSVLVDFTGTSPQMAGGMNVTPAAAASAVLYAIKCVVDPETPQNQGCMRPIEVITFVYWLYGGQLIRYGNRP
jgi:N-methylhydantoinase B